MSIRTVRYFVEPPNGRPPSLIDANGHPMLDCEFDTSQVAHGGFSEILQTSQHTNPLFSLFEDLLVPNNPELVWQGSGPGRGVEMRRTFSALFGRFFARAYLERYHGFTWFAPLDGKETRVSRRIRVRRDASRGDMPDWLCSSPSKIAIAEAKGTRSPAGVSPGKLPGPLKTAADQIARAKVETLRLFPGTQRMYWAPRQVKGWGVMSRWATEQSNRRPLLYVMDPETEGSPIADEEIAELNQDIARFHTPGYPIEQDLSLV